MKRALILLAAALAAAPPAPETFFGHRMGADRSSLEWTKVLRYFDALDNASDRVTVRKFGRSTQGREMIAAFISSPQTLAQLDSFRALNQRLADPRGADPAELARAVSQGKTIVMITCAIHSTEVASTHTAIEFAHRMAGADDPKTRAILDQVVLILVPSLNPDGTDLVTQWYRRTLGTPHEGTSPPELYQKYVGHDNNRDWYIFTQAETRNTISQLHNVWHPQIVYDVHEQGPYASRMFVPPWMDPIEPNADPILIQLSNAIGMGVAYDLTAAGKKGVAVNAMYDLWTPARHYQTYHGGIRILSESATTRLGTPIRVQPEQISQRAQGYDPRQRSWNHLEPWTGGWWRLRDIVDYQLIAFESVLYQAATRREDLLRSFLRVSQNAVARKYPAAFVISKEQRDPEAALTLLRTLAFGAVEVEEAVDAFRADDVTYPSGSYVIRMGQPYSSFAKALLEKQEYPDLRLYPGGPPKRPYDVTAHTLPLLMGVDVRAVQTLTPIKTRPAALTAPLSGRGVLSGSDTASWKRVFRAWSDSQRVWRDPKTGDFRIGGPSPGLEAVLPPRVGLYRSFVPSMDEGWTRWWLDTFGAPYRSIRNPEIVAGKLREKLDVIVFPDQAAPVLAQGYRKGSMPEEYTGGLGVEGARALREFVEQGGRLIFLNDSCEYVERHLDLGLENPVAGIPDQELYSPGSLLRVLPVDDAHPLLRGLPPAFTIWSEQSPVFAGEGWTPVLRYPSSNLLASGWLLGEKHLAGRTALAERRVGSGYVIVFGMRPQYRGQSYLTFKLLLNALIR